MQPDRIRRLAAAATLLPLIVAAGAPLASAIHDVTMYKGELTGDLANRFQDSDTFRLDEAYQDVVLEVHCHGHAGPNDQGLPEDHGAGEVTVRSTSAADTLDGFAISPPCVKNHLWHQGPTSKAPDFEPGEYRVEFDGEGTVSVLLDGFRRS